MLMLRVSHQRSRGYSGRASKGASEIAAAFRTTVKSVQSLFNWCLTSNQMGISSYPARTKRAGLSSLDRTLGGL